MSATEHGRLYFKVVHSVHFLDQWSQLTVPTKCWTRSPDMFRHKRTIFRQRNVPGSKTNSCQWQATTYKVSQSTVGSVVDVVCV
jgi:hypothetical protein